MKSKEERKEYDRLWHIANRVKKRGYDKKYQAKHGRLEKKYGITPEQYIELFNKQEGKCIICNKHQIEFKKALGVDHDHKTGKIRGLLCNDCNLGIGYLKDNIIFLQKAIDYLNNND